MTTRCDPAEDIEILRRCLSGPLDPIIQRGKKGFNSRAVIDACRPYEWIKDFPASVIVPPKTWRSKSEKNGANKFYRSSFAWNSDYGCSTRSQRRGVVAVIVSVKRDREF